MAAWWFSSFVNRFVASLLFKNLEAVVGRSRVFTRSQMKFATKFEAFCTTSILVYLDNVSGMQVSKQRSAFLVFLSQVLAVY